MKQQIQLHIPEPCHENWDAMTGTQQGRFCMSCQKEVIDFSVMTDKEILNYISTASSNMCGRVAHDQLSRNLIAPPAPRKIWWRYWMSAAASIILISTRSYTQGEVVKPAMATQPSSAKNSKPIRLGMMAASKINDEIKIQIQGWVVDEKNNPIPYASIRIAGSSAGVSADSAGNFIMNAMANMSNIELAVSSVGFQQKTISLDQTVDIKSVTAEDGVLKLAVGHIVLTTKSLREVTVTGYSNTERLTAFAGGISVCRQTTRYEKAKAAFKDVLGVNEIKVYPNPISGNSFFNITFTIKDQGEYAVRFTDASGKVIATQQLNIAAKNQVESFNGNIFRTGGVYFVSVSGKQNAKVYTTKLLVQ